MYLFVLYYMWNKISRHRELFNVQLILYVKQYIFACLSQNNMPNFCELLIYLNFKS